MAIAVAERLITAEEFLLTKDPPGMVTELVRGRIVCMPPPSTSHGKWVGRIYLRLHGFSSENDLGEALVEAGFRLQADPDTVRGVDVGFISYDRLPGGKLPATGYVAGAPNLAVEVISPGNVDRDIAIKVAEYLAAGADRVWEVRPGLRTVTVHRSGAEPKTLRVGDTLTSDDAGFAVDGFALPVADIFA